MYSDGVMRVQHAQKRMQSLKTVKHPW